MCYDENATQEKTVDEPFSACEKGGGFRHDQVTVTKSMIPDFETYQTYLSQIFQSGRLTNGGRCVTLLEKELCRYLPAEHCALCANGTLALQLAARVAGFSGKEVVTTPFSYVATTAALLWEGCQPVFADIDEDTLCIDPKKVEEVCSEKTAGIVPVHVFGNACDIEKLDAIAAQLHVPIVYDAAQGFGASYNGRALPWYGDFSALSFHATKIFHTIEGGAVLARTQEEYEHLALLRSFGHVGDEHFCLGINAKLSELHAAAGLCLLGSVSENIARRGVVARMYDNFLIFKHLRKPRLRTGLTYNNAYYPVIFPTEALLLEAFARLGEKEIYPRRYFYPSLTRLPYLPGQHCPVAENIAQRVACLPLYSEMNEETVEKIASIVNRCQ